MVAVNGVAGSVSVRSLLFHTGYLATQPFRDHRKLREKRRRLGSGDGTTVKGLYDGAIERLGQDDTKIGEVAGSPFLDSFVVSVPPEAAGETRRPLNRFFVHR
jgi:hypothetical protein